MTNGVEVHWTGGDKLMALLEELQRDVPAKVLRPALTKAIRVVAKAIREKVPRKYTRVRQTVGSRVMTIKTTSEVYGKAGFAVGKPSAAKVAAQEARTAKRKSKNASAKPGKKRGGVGIGTANVHWLVLGTEDRRTGHKTRRKKGVVVSRRATGNPVAFRGRIDPAKLGLQGAVRHALSASEPEAIRVLLEATKDKLEKEVEKLRRKTS